MSETREKRTIVKKVDGQYVLYNDDTIRLINVRASYPWIGTAQKNVADDGTETFSFSCQGLLDKKTHNDAMKACRGLIDKLIIENKLAKPGKSIPASKKFIKNGDAVDDEGNRLMTPECEGMWVVSSRAVLKERPQARGPRKDPKTGKPERLTPAQSDEMFYGGCYVDMLLRPWPMDNKFGKRVNAALVAVQFKHDGERFGSGRISADDIDDTFDAEDSDSGGWDDDDDDL